MNERTLIFLHPQITVTTYRWHGTVHQPSPVRLLTPWSRSGDHLSRFLLCIDFFFPQCVCFFIIAVMTTQLHKDASVMQRSSVISCRNYELLCASLLYHYLKHVAVFPQKHIISHSSIPGYQHTWFGNHG